MYNTGLDPFSGEAVYTASKPSGRKLQRALLQFFKPVNYFEVREALLRTGRGDLIGSGYDVLIPAQSPKAALRAWMERANRSVPEDRYVHAIEGKWAAGMRKQRLERVSSGAKGGTKAATTAVSRAFRR